MKREVLSTLVDEIRNFLDNEILDDDWEEKPITVYSPNHRHTNEMFYLVRYLQSYNNEIERTLKSDAYRNFNEQVKATESYSNFVASLDNGMQSFGPVILYRLYAKIAANPNRCEEFIDIVLAELDGTAVKWRCKVFLQGLKADGSICAGNLIIRPIDITDLPIYRGALDFQPPVLIQRDLIFNASSVIIVEPNEIPVGLKGLPQIVQRIELMLSKLRVSKGGDWVSTAWFAESEWVTEYSKFSNTTFCPGRPFLLMPDHGINRLSTTTLTSTDGLNFSELESEVFPNLTNDWKTTRKIQLALRMFNECVQRPIEEKLLFSIIGLESLYLSGDTELRLRLAIRIGMLMGLLGYDKALVYKDVLDGYKFRSNFIHGETIDSSGLDEIIHRIIEYLRLSLLVWLEVDSKKSVMNDLLPELESAAMDSEKHELVLEKFINEKLEKSLKRNKYSI